MKELKTEERKLKHILVSGGSRGIGRATVLLFAQKGWKVTYFYKNSPLTAGENITPVKCDISDADAVSAAVASLPRIDCLLSNAGISLTTLAQDATSEDYRKVMDTNFGGLFNLTNAVIPQMVSAKSGTIIAVSSMWGQIGASCEALYSASKGAVDSYVKSLAKELAPSGIRVNAVSPGVIKTDMLSEYTDEDLEALRQDIPLGRLGTPEDIAKVIYFLASDESSYITGQILGVSGGFLI